MCSCLNNSFSFTYHPLHHAGVWEKFFANIFSAKNLHITCPGQGAVGHARPLVQGKPPTAGISRGLEAEIGYFEGFGQFFGFRWFFRPGLLSLQSIFKNQTVMYAVVDIAGKQFKVEKDQYLYAPRIDAEIGTKVQFDRVLLIDADGKVQVGQPTIKGASISCKVLEQVKDDKVIVFKKKRRKGYAKKNGHRQQLTKIQVESISSK